MRNASVKVYRKLSDGKVKYIGCFKFKSEQFFWYDLYSSLLKYLKANKIWNRAERFIVLFIGEGYKPQIFIYHNKVKIIPDEVIDSWLINLILENNVILKNSLEGDKK